MAKPLPYATFGVMQSTIVDLVKEFKKLVCDTFVTARLGNKGDGWTALRSQWLSAGDPTFTKAGAAHPSDVREVFTAMQLSAETQMHDLLQSRELTAIEGTQARLALHEQLSKIVATESDKYKNVSQEKSSISNLFAAAAAPKAGGYGYDTSKPKTTVKTCGSCGAPRGAESLYGNCQYCAQPLFPTKG